MEWKKIQEYLIEQVPERPREMQIMESYAERTGFPIVGPACGQLLYLVARMTGARRIFELGSGFGYSTAWFARAVQENGGGEIHHVVWDAALSSRARGHLEVLGYGNLIVYHVAEAVETLRNTEGPFDLIFNDIDKQAYPDSLDVIADRLRPGGVLAVDNMLWQGRVWDEEDHSAETDGIREMTRRIAHDERWAASLIPIRDGLLLAQKR